MTIGIPDTVVCQGYVNVSCRKCNATGEIRIDRNTDFELTLRGIVDILQQFGLHVCSADNPEVAIRVEPEAEPDVDEKPGGHLKLVT